MHLYISCFHLVEYRGEKLQISLVDLTWEIFRKMFLSSQYQEAWIDEFHEIIQGELVVE